MSEIDLRKGNREFRVPTTRVEHGRAYMGNDVLVTARDVEHAKQLVQEAGFKLNRYFEPTEIKKR